MTAVVDVDYALTLAAVSLAVQTGITADFYTLSASGGGGVQTFTLAAAGNEAGYFALDAATGLLQVSNAAVGAYTLLAASAMTAAAVRKRRSPCKWCRCLWRTRFWGRLPTCR